jgi:archaellum biogenesis ATPase FlaH
MNMFLKAEQRVCLVGFEQTLTHYFLVARKLGVNLQAAGSKGNFSFMNGLSTPYDWTDHVTELETPTNIATTQSLSQASVFSFNGGGSDPNPTKKLFDNVKKWVDRQPKEGSVCLIIDNINYLLNACDNMLQVLDFIQYCTALIEARTAPSCVVILTHSDADSDEKFIQSLRYRADLIMKVDGFASGYSKDIDGELTFVQKSASKGNANNHGVNSLPHLQFKLLESTVKFNTVRKYEIKL